MQLRSLVVTLQRSNIALLQWFDELSDLATEVI